jgi:hypothetical protein
MIAQAGVTRSAIDEARFGIRVARNHALTAETLEETLAFCREQAIDMLIARTPSQAIRFVQQLETLGFQLMDTLVYYRRDLTRTPIPEPQDAALDPSRAERRRSGSARYCCAGFSGLLRSLSRRPAP